MFLSFFFFFFNDTATTEIYTLSLHDALPISTAYANARNRNGLLPWPAYAASIALRPRTRSEEHTSELQSQSNLVCRLLLEKKKKKKSSKPKTGSLTSAEHKTTSAARPLLALL